MAKRIYDPLSRQGLILDPALKADLVDNKVPVSQLPEFIVDSSPKGVFADLAALNLADPDHQYIYVTLNDGKWNFWGGSAFISGGIYQSPTAVSYESQTLTEIQKHQARTNIGALSFSTIDGGNLLTIYGGTETVDGGVLTI